MSPIPENVKRVYKETTQKGSGKVSKTFFFFILSRNLWHDNCVCMQCELQLLWRSCRRCMVWVWSWRHGCRFGVRFSGMYI